MQTVKKQIEYRFKVTGTHEGAMENPIGYKRVLANKMRAGDEKYFQYREWIRKNFDTQVKNKPRIVDEFPIHLTKDQRAYMALEIVFNNEKHPDVDNVFKGFADALFKNDKKLLSGMFDADIVRGIEPFVQVTIIITDTKP